MFAVYIRVSTKEQNLESQRAEIAKWLDAHQIDQATVRWFEDKQSGRDMSRPGFKDLQRLIATGKVSTVLVWKIDRLSRSFRQGMKVMIDWLNHNVRLVSVTQQLDMEGLVGQAMAALLFAVAEMELQTSKERQAAGIAVAKAKGKYKGRKPGSTKGKPERAKLLRKSGLSIPEIASAMALSERTVHNYLAT